MCTLTAPQEQVLALISAGSTIAGAAQTAGVHRNTVHNWARSTEFRIALVRARETKALYWREQAEELAASALDTIRAIMTDPALPAAVRLKAAQSILDLAIAPPPELASRPIVIDDWVLHSADSAAEPPVVPARLALNPLEIVHNSAQPMRRTAAKVGRNEPCPCGSGRKFKYCCLHQGDSQALDPVNQTIGPY